MWSLIYGNWISVCVFWTDCFMISLNDVKTEELMSISLYVFSTRTYTQTCWTGLMVSLNNLWWLNKTWIMWVVYKTEYSLYIVHKGTEIDPYNTNIHWILLKNKPTKSCSDFFFGTYNSSSDTTKCVVCVFLPLEVNCLFPATNVSQSNLLTLDMSVTWSQTLGNRLCLRL